MASGIAAVRVKIEANDNPRFTGPAYNLWHVNYDIASALPTLGAAVTDLAAFYTALNSRYSNGTTITVGDQVVGTGPPPNTIFGVTPSVVTGVQTDPSYAAQVAVVLTFRGSFTGARYRGRKFLGPLTTTSLTDGAVNAATVTAVLGAWDALQAALAANAFPQSIQVYSRQNDTASAATARSVSTRPGTLRSRV